MLILENYWVIMVLFGGIYSDNLKKKADRQKAEEKKSKSLEADEFSS